MNNTSDLVSVLGHLHVRCIDYVVIPGHTIKVQFRIRGQYTVATFASRNEQYAHHSIELVTDWNFSNLIHHITFVPWYERLAEFFRKIGEKLC